MTHFDPVAWINTPRWQTSRLGLDRMRELLERMGRPQDDLRFVHVAGTNGKGSTCAYLDAVLRAAGYRVGLFTSPFIECFEERIRVNGVNISPDDLARAVAAVRPHAEAMEAATGDHPTEFELMCAVALEHFRMVNCDIVVLEVGLGGRLDATNVIDAPEVSIITRIGLDHTDLLGNTLAAVAGEKAGIVKGAPVGDARIDGAARAGANGGGDAACVRCAGDSGVAADTRAGAPVVSWPQEPEAMDVIAQVAAECGCALAVPDFTELAVGSIEHGVRSFAYCGARYTTQLLGSYQPFNATLAVEAVNVLRARGWRVTDEALACGISQAVWPGRFEVVGMHPLTIIDGGHNPQGAQALADSLADLLGAPRGEAAAEGASDDSAAARSDAPVQGGVTFVMGVLADKDYDAMLDAVIPFAQSIVAYAPNNPRALPADDLVAAARSAAMRNGNAALAQAVRAASSPAEALAQARAQAGSDGVIVAFGTLYAIADIKAAL